MAGMLLPVFFAFLQPLTDGPESFAGMAVPWMGVIVFSLFLNLLAIALIRDEGLWLRLLGVISTFILQGLSLACLLGSSRGLSMLFY